MLKGKLLCELCFLPGVALAVLAGCTTKKTALPSDTFSHVNVESVTRQKLPATVVDKAGWGQDLAVTFKSLKIPPVEENICAVLAVAQQESGLVADPVIPGLNNIAWKEIERRAGKLHIPDFVIRTALLLISPDGKSYRERLDNVRTERQLSAIFDDFIGMVPMGKTLFGHLNPVHTGGVMQVSIAFAQQHQNEYPWKMQGTVRQEVFTRRGGIWFGTYHLLNYPTHYPSLLYRFADFNAGWYASRNAAFQYAVSLVSGVKLAFDGDVILYNSDKVSQTEFAVQKIARQIDMSDDQVHAALKKGDGLKFGDSSLYKRIFALAELRAGKKLPREILPGIMLESPKISRNLTTAWFARRVNERFTACMKR